MREMSERRVLSEDAAFRLLAHFVATAELHIVEGPFYTDRRILEGTLPLIDAMIEDSDPAGRAWLDEFKADIQHALTDRSRDRQAYDDYLREAPGQIVSEINRRRGAVRDERS